MIRRVLLALALLLAPLHETAEAQQSAAARRCAIYLCGGARPALDLNFAATGAFPTNVTYSGASQATMVSSAGLLVTKPQNLVTWSTDLTNAAWFVTQMSVTANQGAGPFTSQLALLTITTATDPYIREVVTIRPGSTMRMSWYLKRGNQASVALRTIFSGGTILDRTGTYNFDTDTLAPAGGTAMARTLLANGIVRVSIIASDTNGNNTSYENRMRPGLAGGETLGDTVLASDPQVEVVLNTTISSGNAAAASYNPTTSPAYFGPRFVYDPAALTPLGYLSETAATNIQLHSQFDSGWSVTGGTLTANNVTSPDGSADAATFTEDTSTGLHAPNITATTTITANTIYTGSMWLKAGTRTNAVLSWENAGPTDAVRVNVDLNACTVSAGSVVGTGVISGTPTSQQWPNGWCRVFIAGTINAASTAAFLVPYGANPAGTVSYTGTSATFQVFGADIKLGLDYSSYIPTTAASVTRAADVATIALSSTSIPASPSALTIIGKSRTPVGFGANNSWVATLDDGSANNRIGITRNVGGNGIQNFIEKSGVTSVNQTLFTPAPGITDIRFWLAARAGDSAAQVIGQTKATSSAAVMPVALTEISIGSTFITSGSWGSTVARLQIYNARLPDGRASAIAAGM